MEERAVELTMVKIVVLGGFDRSGLVGRRRWFGHALLHPPNINPSLRKINASAAHGQHFRHRLSRTRIALILLILLFTFCSCTSSNYQSDSGGLSPSPRHRIPVRFLVSVFQVPTCNRNQVL